VGDFNAKHQLWGSPINDFRGKLIVKFLDDNNLVCLNKGEGTRLNYNGTLSHLDLAICSHNLGFDIECEKINDLWGSDHYPLEVFYKPIIVRIDDTINKYLYNKTDWKLFQTILTEDNSFDIPVDDVERAYHKLISAYYKARDMSVPIKKGEYRHKYSPYWNPECSEAKRKKN